MKPRYNFSSAALLILGGIILASAGMKSNCTHEANVQLEKMYVFYIGVDNPVTISVSGIAYDNVIVETDNGTITPVQKPGGYIVRIDSNNRTVITVSYKDGAETVTAGQYIFRNKKVPDPRTYINSIRTEGIVLKENIASINGVFTRMENFDFDCSFKPQSFSMSVIENGEWKEYKAAGPELTPEMKAALTKCEEEDKILFHNVMTKGPAGDVRLSNAVILTVK